MSSTGAGVPNVAVMGALVLFYAVFMAIIVTITIIVWWKICSKAGFSGWLSLLMLVPIANLILILVIAFADWPVHKELRALRQAHGIAPQ
jgi:hypothetical protein